MRIRTTLLFLSLLPVMALSDVLLFQDGVVKSQIVLPQHPTPSESFAAKELQEHLEQITERKWSTAAEQDNLHEKNRIFLGNTQFSINQGIRSETLEDEEWIVMTVAGNLLLNGGNSRGVIYAVYEFLEKILGCRWFDEHNSKIPKHTEIVLSDINNRAQPVFARREIYDLLTGVEPSMTHKQRNKVFSLLKKDAGGGGIRMGSPNGCHTMYYYSKDWPLEQEELWALNKDGRRIPSTSASSIGFCPSNPEARSRTLEKLLDYIRLDREKAKTMNVEYPRIYDLSQNDTAQYCHCPHCLERLQKYGSPSGVMLEMLNDIAARVEITYPDIFLQTFAYLHTQTPPENIRPRHNVIIRLAVLGYEFIIDGKNRDSLRELQHPNNRDMLSLLQAWSRKTDHLAIWDYWRLYGVHNFNTFAPMLQTNLKTYRKHGVTNVYVECQHAAESSFYGLGRYLGMKLLDNPEQDVRKLTNEFMDTMYGTAAEDMKRFYDFVVESQNRPGIPLGTTTLLSSRYMNLEFFQNALNLLNAALVKVRPDSPLHANIERELVPVYECLIGRWNILQRQNPGRPLPWDKQKLHQDFERLAMAAYNYYFPPHFPKVYRKKRSDEIERKKMFFLEQAPQTLPKEIAGREVIVVPLYDFAKNIQSIRFVKDPEANGALAIEHFGEQLIKHAKHVEMGLYSQSNKTWINDVRIPLPEFPKDEKYHLYHLGTLKFADKPGRVVSYAWPSWAVNCNIDRYLPRQIIADSGIVDVYLSAKLQGNTFIQGSEKEDAFRVDALYIVMHEANASSTP